MIRDPLPSDIQYPFIEAPIVKEFFPIVPDLVEQEKITKRSIVEMLEDNIKQYDELKKTVTKQFIANNENIEKYVNKLNTAKQEHSKALFGKKVTKYKAQMVGYLQQMEQIDLFVESLQRSITRILAPQEDTKTIESIPVEGELI